MTADRDDLIDDLVERMTALVRRVDWRGAEAELRNVLAEATTALAPPSEGRDLSEPIRKLRKRARHHREVAKAEREFAPQADDQNLRSEALASAEDHDKRALDFEAAVEILEREAQREQSR